MSTVAYCIILGSGFRRCVHPIGCVRRARPRLILIHLYSKHHECHKNYSVFIQGGGIVAGAAQVQSSI